MKSNQRTAIWPYLLVLAVLFVLTLVAPRTWGPAKLDLRTNLAERPVNRRPPPPAPTIVLPAPESTVARYTRAPAEPQHSFEPPLPVFEPVNELIASERLEPESTSEHAEPPVAQPPVAQPPVAQPVDAPQSAKPLDDSAEIDAGPNLANWPDPITLRQRLADLSVRGATADWAATVDGVLAELQQTAIAEKGSQKLLESLRDLSDASSHVSTPLEADDARALLHTRLELLRRLDTWSEVDEDSDHFVTAASAVVDRQMQSIVRRVIELTDSAPTGKSWRDYLQLSTLDDLARRRGETVAEERATAARRVLGRLRSPRMTPPQRHFVAHDSIAALDAQLRRWLAANVPPGEVLYAVETYEDSRLPSDARVLADHIARLRWSPQPSNRRLGEQLERQYRNANLRLVVTASLINRLLPEQAPQTEWVNDTVVGVPARGYSTTATQLTVRLLPDPNRLQFTLEARGVVDSQTSSTSGPVTFHNNGQSTYAVRKDIALDREGFRLGPVIAEAESSTSLGSLQTNFDSIPIVRSLVRSYALSQREERIGEAEQEVEAKVARRATDRFDTEVTARLASAEAQLRDKVISPLTKLGVDPAVISLSTTAERMTMRFRVAGQNQLGAHTPRPLAMSNSLASLQVHESALNNSLEQLELAGRTFTLPELHAWLNQRLSRGAQPLPDDLPEHVVVTFAEYDPVRITCDDGRVKLTLAIAEIDQGRNVWHDMEVTAYYRAIAAGQQLEFAREGAIELGGDAHVGRVDFVLRGIFAKILSQKRRLSLRMPADTTRPKLAGLHFSDVTVENGWISLAISAQSGN